MSCATKSHEASRSRAVLTLPRLRDDPAAMSFLLPQERTGSVQAAREVDLHGDRWMDLLVAFDGETSATTLRLSAEECPGGLGPGDRVLVRFVMGVATSVRRV